MGLLDKVKKKPAEAEVPEPEVREEYEEVSVNVTDKMLRVELLEGRGYVKHGTVERTEDHVLIVSSGGIIIAEIGKRGKAFKELDPYAGRRVEAITITAKTGDYGDYFRISMKFKSMVVTV